MYKRPAAANKRSIFMANPQSYSCFPQFSVGTATSDSSFSIISVPVDWLPTPRLKTSRCARTKTATALISSGTTKLRSCKKAYAFDAFKSASVPRGHYSSNYIRMTSALL